MFLDNFDDATHELESLESRLTELRHDHERQIDGVNSEITDATDECAKLDARLDTVEAELRRQADTLATLQRTATSNAAQPADFDSFSTTERTFARNAEQARELREQLLADRARRTDEDTVNRHDTAADTVTQHEEALLHAARAIAELPYQAGNSDERETAATHYRECDQQLTRSRAALQRYLPEHVEDARARLDEDKRLRAKHGATIDAGARDRKKLLGSLRTRLDEAITNGHTLPVWFRTVLGGSPPPTQTPGWINTALSLLAYRLTYDVQDQLVALGNPPRNDEPQRQHTWYHEITNDMHKYRRSF